MRQIIHSFTIPNTSTVRKNNLASSLFDGSTKKKSPSKVVTYDQVIPVVLGTKRELTRHVENVYVPSLKLNKVYQGKFLGEIKIKKSINQKI